MFGPPRSDRTQRCVTNQAKCNGDWGVPRISLSRPVTLTGRFPRLAGVLSGHASQVAGNKRHHTKNAGGLPHRDLNCPRIRDAKSPKGQEAPRAPQPNCALGKSRMSDSRRFKTSVCAALQQKLLHPCKSAARFAEMSATKCRNHVCDPTKLPDPQSQSLGENPVKEKAGDFTSPGLKNIQAERRRTMTSIARLALACNLLT
jgi:hypothetical protein